MSPLLDARSHLLFATDLHARSRPLLTVACRFAEAVGARVTLVHAVEPRSTRTLSRFTRRDLLDRAREDAESALALQARELAGSGVDMGQPILTVDLPAHRAILKAIEQTGADLVLAGSTAREGKGRRIGSTADRLLRASPVPVLVLRGEPEVPFSSVAFLTDFSARSRRAHLSGARLVPTTPGADVELVYVGNQTFRSLDPSYEGRTLAEAESEARALDEALGAAEGRCTARVEWGQDPLDTLVSTLEHDDYGIVVLGTHGHGPFRRALIGSVAMGIAQSAPCSVLVVPGR
jgi:nucleotide-binding universal stress UspA family protein